MDVSVLIDTNVHLAAYYDEDFRAAPVFVGRIRRTKAATGRAQISGTPPYAKAAPATAIRGFRVRVGIKEAQAS